MIRTATVTIPLPQMYPPNHTNNRHSHPKGTPNTNSNQSKVDTY